MLSIVWGLFQLASPYLHVFSLQFRPREVSISFCSITDLSLVYFLHPAYSSFLACNAKLQLPSTIAKMDSGSIPTKATHLELLPTFMDGKHHSMDTVSLYLAIKVIHSSCYIADLFRITPTAHPEANKLLKRREINLPKPISGLSNYIWNAFALPANLGRSWYNGDDTCKSSSPNTGMLQTMQEEQADNAKFISEDR